MPSLKSYRDRIASVKSTRKITSAMKMVAASKLKKAQEQAEASQPYARAMAAMMARVAANVDAGAMGGLSLLAGTGRDDVHLLVVVTADRGLCGGFNGNLVRLARQEARALERAGKKVRIVCVGRKGRDLLRREFGDRIVEHFSGIGAKGRIAFAEADQVSQYVLQEFEAGGFDVCSLVYNEFRSILSQKPVVRRLVPFGGAEEDAAEAPRGALSYSFEPEEQEILGQLLPKNLSVQIFRALLDSAAGEQASRMTAMDNATRNAGDMIGRLTLQYNRARQAAITKELIEIISGAEAV